MWVGQQLADGLDFWGFLGSLILGGIILGIYTGLLGYVGAKTGLSLDLLSQRAFGEKGSYLPSAMTSFTQIGWFGVGSFVSGGTATPNFARFAKDGKAGAITTVVAFFIGNSLMFFFGAVSSIFVGGNDIFEVMVRLNLFYLAVLVLGLNIWTAGLFLQNMALIEKYSKKPRFRNFFVSAHRFFVPRLFFFCIFFDSVLLPERFCIAALHLRHSFQELLQRPPIPLSTFCQETPVKVQTAITEHAIICSAKTSSLTLPIWQSIMRKQF